MAEDPPTAFLRGDAQADRKSLRLLLGAIARVSASRDLESLLEYVVDSSLEATGAERGFLVLLDSQTGQQVVRVAREAGGRRLEDDVQYSTSVIDRSVIDRSVIDRSVIDRSVIDRSVIDRSVIDRSVIDRALESGEPVRSIVGKNAEELGLGPSLNRLKIRSVMCVPLVPLDAERRRTTPGGGPSRQVGAAPLDSRVGLPVGALYVDSKATNRAFKENDLSLFHALAQHIAIVLENAYLNQQALEKARLERSLEIAAEIQAGLLPKAAPTVADYELFGWYQPAEHASGDFYDYEHSKGGGLGVVVGDVTGHGVGPALVSATAQASLRS